MTQTDFNNNAITTWESNYLKVITNLENSQIKVEWFPTTEEMGDEDYQNALNKITDIVKEHHIKGWIGDTSNFRKAISPELQEWQSTIISGLGEAGLEKLAVIAPEEFIASLSVEQSVDEILSANGNKLVIQYFDSLDRAQEWIH